MFPAFEVAAPVFDGVDSEEFQVVVVGVPVASGVWRLEDVVVVGLSARLAPSTVGSLLPIPAGPTGVAPCEGEYPLVGFDGGNQEEEAGGHCGLSDCDNRWRIDIQINDDQD